LIKIGVELRPRFSAIDTPAGKVGRNPRFVLRARLVGAQMLD
jgi:hypothetical protein